MGPDAWALFPSKAVIVVPVWGKGWAERSEQGRFLDSWVHWEGEALDHWGL